jgi:hypothetical protein
MGIISSLLTGGIVIGKICQAIGGLGSNKSGQLGVSGDVSAGGVVFYRSNVSGTSQIYAYNPNTRSHASVVVPNEADSGGVTYVIAPTEKIPFAEAESPLVAPSTTVTTGLTDAAQNQGVDATAGPGSLFKLAFKGLKVGGNVTIGSFSLSCTTTQLAIVSPQITLGALTYFWFNSNKGIQANNTSEIPRDPPVGNGVNAVNEARYTIDFSALGIDIANDSVDGMLTVKLPSSTIQQLRALSKVESQPLHPSEVAALTKYGHLA